MEGRINTLGMGINITAEFFTYMFVIAFIFNTKNKSFFYIFVMLLSFLVISITGSRRAIVVVFFIVFLYKIRSFNKKKRIIYLLSLSIMLFVFSMFSKSVIHFLAEKTHLSTFLRLDETLNMQVESEENIDGRYIMYLNTFYILMNSPMGFGNSDWLIQDKLSLYGTGSHTHNFFLQNYLKYGFATILLIYPIRKIFLGIKYNTYTSYLFIGIMINQFTGVGFWNIKYLILVTIFFVINMKEIKLIKEIKNA
jgi:hypothetical protein